MNTKLMQTTTSHAADKGQRRGIVAPNCLSVHSPVYVLYEPPSP